MDADVARRLAALPPLDPGTAQAQARRCKICQTPAYLSGVTDFLKCAGGYAFGASGVTAPWFACVNCDYLFTDFFDDWTAAEFARFLYNDDYVKVDPEYTGARSRREFQALSGLIPEGSPARVLDYGGGAGGLAALLRERGIDATSYDPFSRPERPGGKFDIITCIEVMEHSPDPVATLGDVASLLAPGGCILLGITLQPANIAELGPTWWYCAPRNGHCSTYSLATLSRLGERWGLTLHASDRTHWLAWRFADAPSEIASRMGSTFEFMYLGAPKHDHPDWHGLETTFRWSGAETIVWRRQVDQTPTIVRVKLLYKMEPVPGYAQRCRLTVQGQPLPIAPGATVDVVMESPGVVTAVLTQDALICPADNGSPDTRRLGLAVLTP